MLAQKLGKKGILLPACNAREAAAVPNIDVIAIRHLKEAVQFFLNPATISPVPGYISEDIFKKTACPIDFADIKGQTHVKRAAEIAAAGGHNILLSGPPVQAKP